MNEGKIGKGRSDGEGWGKGENAWLGMPSPFRLRGAAVVLASACSVLRLWMPHKYQIIINHTVREDLHCAVVDIDTLSVHTSHEIVFFLVTNLWLIVTRWGFQLVQALPFVSVMQLSLNSYFDRRVRWVTLQSFHKRSFSWNLTWLYWCSCSPIKFHGM